MRESVLFVLGEEQKLSLDSDIDFNTNSLIEYVVRLVLILSYKDVQILLMHDCVLSVQRIPFFHRIL